MLAFTDSSMRSIILVRHGESEVGALGADVHKNASFVTVVLVGQ